MREIPFFLKEQKKKKMKKESWKENSKCPFATLIRFLTIALITASFEHSSFCDFSA